MSVEVAPCPHCGQDISVSHPAKGRFGGVRRRLRRKHRLARETCPVCGEQFDVREA